jgi:8-oxo-dGTP pyrophosphatase MutT (NUDIX family)
MPTIVSKTVSVYAFKIVRGRPLHLLLRRAPGKKLPGAWQAVHGHVERGESSAEAAARELVEETGLALRSLWAIDYVERVFDPKKDEIRLVPAFAALVAGDVKLSKEHDAVHWLSAKDASRLFTFENQRAAVAVVERDVARVLAKGGAPNPFLRVM